MSLAICVPKLSPAVAPSPAFCSTSAELRKVLRELEANLGHRPAARLRLKEVERLQELLERGVRPASLREPEPSRVA